MNELSRITDRAPALAGGVEPAMSRDLAREVDRLTEADQEARALAPFDSTYVTPPMRQEASRAADLLDSLLQPVTRGQFAAWLGTVNAACRNPQDEAAFKARMLAIGSDCGHLPGGCFTVEGRRALYAVTAFFPAAADVLAALEPIARRLRGKAAALRRIADPAPVAETVARARDEVTDDMRAHASAQVAALKRDLAERANATGGRTEQNVQPRHLTPAQLQLACQQRIALGGPGADGARVRLEHLRRQFGDLLGNTGGARA